jgi:Predicted Na+-dependent transporter
MKTVPTTLLLLVIVLTATVPVVRVHAYIAGAAIVSSSSNSPLLVVGGGPSWHHGHARQDASTYMTCRMTTLMKTFRVVVPVVPAREGFRKMTWLHQHLHDMDNVEEEEDVWETSHEIGGNGTGSEEEDATTSQSASLPVVVGTSSSSISRISKGCKVFSTCMPLWTVLVAFYASRYPSNKLVSMVGSMGVMQHAFLVLMVAMGLAVERIPVPVPVPVPVLRDDGDNNKKKKYGCDSTSMGRNVKPLSFFVSSFLRPYVHPYQYRAIVLNALLCFGMMPLLSRCIASVACQDRSQQVGMILLGCVSGGQASNLFALLAGGDVTLSILCTLTTTLLGVIFTPFWIRMLLRQVVVVAAVPAPATNGWDVLQSVAKLVLVPVTAGMLVRDVILFRMQRNVEDWNTASVAKDVIQKILCPTMGILATLILVAGGAANSAMLLDGQIVTPNLSNKYLVCSICVGTGGRLSLHLLAFCQC